MSAIVCGKRSFFEDVDVEMSPSPAYKKYRCSSSASPVRFGSPPLQSSPVDKLRALFPKTKFELLVKALEESGNNVDLAIKYLQDLSLESSESTSSTNKENIDQLEGSPSIEESAKQVPQVQKRLPVDGAEWVGFLVKEMSCASSLDDARSRAANVLESFEKDVSTRVATDTAQAFIKENTVLKEQVEVLLRDNVILKRGVAIQHDRQKEYDQKNHEVQQLKMILAQCQEQIRTVEMKNYALTLRLRQAEQSSPIPGHFHPDVF